MNGFFGRLGDSLRTFMVGRYGIDSMSVALAIAAIHIIYIRPRYGDSIPMILFQFFPLYYSSAICSRGRKVSIFRHLITSASSTLRQY